MKASLTNNLEYQFSNQTKNNKRHSWRLLFFIDKYYHRHPTSSTVILVLLALLCLMFLIHSRSDLIIMSFVLLCGYIIGVAAEIMDTNTFNTDV